MLRFYATTLLICLHVKPIQNIIVLGDFLINNNFIKEVLCINKEKPALACEGKCYLMQQLQKSQQSQEKEWPNMSLSRYEFIFFESQLIPPSTITFDLNSIPFPNYYSLLRNAFILDVFHPPN